MAAKTSLARPQKRAAQTRPNLRPTAAAPLTYAVTFFYPGFWKEHRFPVLILLALAFVLYGTTLGFGYLLDDQLVTWGNIFVQKGFGGLVDIFSNDSLLGYYVEQKNLLEGGRYRPLPLMTYAFEVGLFGKNSPGVSHFFNVLLYGITGVLLYRILLGLFPVQEDKSRFFSLPFWATALFLLHPLHSEVVANIKGRDEMLALLGSLGALYATLKFFDTGRKSWLWLAAASFFLGLLSKENAATFLAVIPLTLWMFSKIPLERIFTACLSLLGAALLFLLIRLGALGYLEHSKPMDVMALNPFAGMTFLEKYATILLTLGWYLKLFLLPHPLTIDYYPYHVPKTNWTDWRVLLSLAIYVWMGFWAFRQMRNSRLAGPAIEQWRIPAYCILFYLLTISVVSNIFVNTSTFMNERYSYMPSIGFCLLAAWFVTRKLPAWLSKQADIANAWSVGLVAVVAILFALRVWTRVPDWGGNGAAMVEATLRVSPNSYRANYYYGAMLYQERYAKMAEASDAKSMTARKALVDSMNYYLDRSLTINPGHQLAGILKTTTAAAQYRDDKQLDKLLQTFEQLIKNQPYNGEMLTNLLAVLKSIKGVDPNVYNYFCHRVGYAFYFKQKGDLLGAVEFLNLALANYPQDKNTLGDLLEVYTVLGNQAKAAEVQQRINAL